MIPREIVEQVLEKVDIEALVGQRVTLKRRGQVMVGLCPFHGEKTPSFTVSARRGTYHCFGCSAGGDAAAFLMGLDGLTFPEAIAELAERVGVDLPTQSQEDAEQARASAQARKRYLEIQARAAKLWGDALWKPQGAGARAYLQERGVDEATARRWGLGFAPVGLCAKMDAAGVSVAEQVASGLVAQYDDGGRAERFRGRLVFPVRDPWGRVLGFSGRLLDPDAKAAKYVNSPETACYKKGDVLLGLDLAQDLIRARGFAVLVEGNFDAVAAQRAGLGAVAPCGTALTASQARLLVRLTQSVVVAFDGDKAGQEASVKAVGILEAAGLMVRVARLPKGQDPASMTAAALEAAVARAVSGTEFLIEAKIEPALGLGLEDRVAAKDAALEIVAQLLDTNLRRHYAQMIGARLGLVTVTPQAVEAPEGEATPPRRLDPLEARMVRLLAQSPTWHREFVEAGLLQMLQTEALVVFVELALSRGRGGWRAAAMEAQECAGDAWEGMAEQLMAIAARAEAEPLQGDSYAGAVERLASRYISQQRRLMLQAKPEMRGMALDAFGVLCRDIWDAVEWCCKPWKEGCIPVEPVEDAPAVMGAPDAGQSAAVGAVGGVAVVGGVVVGEVVRAEVAPVGMEQGAGVAKPSAGASGGTVAQGAAMEHGADVGAGAVLGGPVAGSAQPGAGVMTLGKVDDDGPWAGRWGAKPARGLRVIDGGGERMAGDVLASQDGGASGRETQTLGQGVVLARDGGVGAAASKAAAASGGRGDDAPRAGPW